MNFRFHLVRRFWNLGSKGRCYYKSVKLSLHPLPYFDLRKVRGRERVLMVRIGLYDEVQVRRRRVWETWGWVGAWFVNLTFESGIGLWTHTYTSSSPPVRHSYRVSDDGKKGEKKCSQEEPPTDDARHKIKRRGASRLRNCSRITLFRCLVSSSIHFFLFFSFFFLLREEAGIREEIVASTSSTRRE